MLDRWRRWARRLKREVYALYLSLRHPRTPWYARLVIAAVIAYALSPLDLIPDVIPVLGLLDDLILLPLGLALAVRLIPADVLAECRAEAEAALTQPGGAGRIRWGGARLAALIIALIWLGVAAVVLVVVGRALRWW